MQASNVPAVPPSQYPPKHLPAHLRIAFIHPDLGLGAHTLDAPFDYADTVALILSMLSISRCPGCCRLCRSTSPPHTRPHPDSTRFRSSAGPHDARGRRTA